MTIAICLIIKDENQYLEEWLNHHRKLGIDFFIIYDNNSEVSVSEYIKDNNLNNVILMFIYGHTTKCFHKY